MDQRKGGPALWQTLKGYTEHGWNVFFITSNRAKSNPQKLHEKLYVIRFDAPWLKHLTQFRKLGFFAKITWWLYFQYFAFIKAVRFVRKHNKIDLVYGYEIYGVPVAKVLSWLWHVPIVSRFQGTSFGLGWINKRFRNLRAWDHFIGLKLPADLIIMADDGTQGDRVLKELGVDFNRVRFWMNGVEWGSFEDLPRPQAIRKSLRIDYDHVLITVSRLVKWKWVDRTIQALPGVVKDFPKTILVVVGDGPERGRLVRLAHDLGLAEHVRFEGAVPHAEIPKYLAAADIFLSLYDLSNVGNPLLEAMMARKCIITLNNGDTSHYVKNGYNGILLNYEELSTLPEVIKKLLVDEQLRTKLETNARVFAEKHFWTWEERMAAEIQAVDNLLK